MRLQCAAILDQRLENAGLIFLSKNPVQLEKHCTRFLLLIESRLVPCDNLKLGIEALKQSATRTPTPPQIQLRNEKNHE
jgi:capsular polysaccharide transport system ATP-binding protein